jgi:hypothetical protein
MRRRQGMTNEPRSKFEACDAPGGGGDVEADVSDTGLETGIEEGAAPNQAGRVGE